MRQVLIALALFSVWAIPLNSAQAEPVWRHDWRQDAAPGGATATGSVDFDAAIAALAINEGDRHRKAGAYAPNLPSDGPCRQEGVSAGWSGGSGSINHGISAECSQWMRLKAKLRIGDDAGARGVVAEMDRTYHINHSWSESCKANFTSGFRHPWNESWRTVLATINLLPGARYVSCELLR